MCTSQMHVLVLTLPTLRYALVHVYITSGWVCVCMGYVPDASDVKSQLSICYKILRAWVEVLNLMRTCRLVPCKHKQKCRYQKLPSYAVTTSNNTGGGFLFGWWILQVMQQCCRMYEGLKQPFWQRLMADKSFIRGVHTSTQMCIRCTSDPDSLHSH